MFRVFMAFIVSVFEFDDSLGFDEGEYAVALELGVEEEASPLCPLGGHADVGRTVGMVEAE